MFILINLKTYVCDSVEIARIAKDVSEEFGARVAVAPQAIYLKEVANTGVETWAQHIDAISGSANTGRVTANELSRMDIKGSIVNHSERRLLLAEIDECVKDAFKNGMETVVCANNPNQIAAVTALGPDFVAIEPPELIGSGIPVSKAAPDIVKVAVESAKRIDPNIPVLCGAGISTGEDVSAAIGLGAKGILLASGIAKSKDPSKALRGLLE